VPTSGRDGTELAWKSTEASLFEAILWRIAFVGLPKAGNTHPTYNRRWKTMTIMSRATSSMVFNNQHSEKAV
jgi:hypothetical protein